MAEEQAPNFQGMPQSARTKKYNKLYDTLTSQTVGDRSFADMYAALQEAEVGAYKEKTGWPYIFTGASRKSSAFGPLQITYSTALDYFYPGDSETEKRDNMKAGNFKEGYTQLPSDVKGYIKDFIEQGINKRNRKGGVYGSYGVGDISAEDHKKHYPFLAAVHVNEKKKLADADTVPAFVNAHFGDIQEDDPQKENKERQLANLQTKVSDTLGVTVRPVTTDVVEGFSEPVTVTPEPAPAAPETKTQTDEAFTLDYEGELPDIGDEVKLPDLPAEDVAPETTDAIPVTPVEEPEQPGLFDKFMSMFSSKDDPDRIQERESAKQNLLQELETFKAPEMNKGGIATAIQEAEDIESGADSRTKKEMIEDQMAGIKATGKTVAENIPGVGEAIVAKEVAEDISSGDYLSAGIGTAALGMGFLPAGDILNKPLRAAAKKFRKQDNESAKKLMTDEPMFNIWKKENKLEESQRQKRVPKVQQAAIDLSAGKITSKEYRRTVTANQPIQPITKENFPDMPTKTEIVGALKATDPRKVDTGIIGLNKSIPDGTRVGSRLDIPSYDNYDKWIVSLHDGTVRNGKAIGYGQTAVLKNAEFISSAKGGVGIAKGKDKTTIARIHGDYQNAEPENVFEAAKRLIDDPEWTQVGMNPFRHSYFYDKATGNPVTKADEVIQVGPLVLAKGVKKPTLSEMKELVGGTKVVKDGKVTYKGAVRTEDGKIRTFNEGGMAMERQMNMFEDGGLMDEGGMIDEESGNDVPPGSLREEVRDDIPAQLSEGEFVFPADVVRYWGLEKLMEMRQEAKAGLARMEAMGQMGNADEATLPDDIPFDLDDLDMEDEPMEFQQGGLVPNPYGVYQQPSQFATYGQQPYQAPQMPVAPVTPQVPLQTGFTPVTTPVTPTAPTFEELLPTTTGRYDELREYVNSDTGESMTIPFVDGKPIYPIPTGFTPKPTEQVEAAVPEDTVVPTATVQKEEGDGGVKGPEYATTDVTGIGYDRSQLTPALRETISEYGFGFGALAEVAGKTNVANVIGELMGKDPKVAAKNLTSSAFGGVLDAFRGGEVSFSDPNRMGMKTGKYNDNTPLHEMSATKQIDIATVADRVMKDMQGVFTDEKGKPKTTAEATRSMKALADSLGVSTTVEGTNLTKSLTTLMREVSKQKGIQVKAQLEAEKAEAERQRAAQQAANTAAAIIAAQQNKDDNADPESKGPGGTGYGSGNQGISHAGGGAGGRFGPSGGFAEGGLASKPKPKKTKKMKRGGLASK